MRPESFATARPSSGSGAQLRPFSHRFSWYATCASSLLTSRSSFPLRPSARPSRSTLGRLPGPGLRSGFASHSRTTVSSGVALAMLKRPSPRAWPYPAVDHGLAGNLGLEVVISRALAHFQQAVPPGRAVRLPPFSHGFGEMPRLPASWTCAPWPRRTSWRQPRSIGRACIAGRWTWKAPISRTSISMSKK